MTGLESYDLESYDATMESNIYQEALKIIDGKFPVETTQIKICGKRLEIIKEKGTQPFMIEVEVSRSGIEIPLD